MGLTARQQRFVDEYLISLNAADAARKAGYSVKTANRMGSENLTKPDIQQQIQRSRLNISKRNEITVDSLVAELEEARQLALTAGSPNCSAAVAATLGKAKLCGLVTDKVASNVTGEIKYTRIENVITDPQNPGS